MFSNLPGYILDFPEQLPSGEYVPPFLVLLRLYPLYPLVIPARFQAGGSKRSVCLWVPVFIKSKLRQI